jgi:formylmethanofuran dehydrogenase subunit E
MRSTSLLQSLTGRTPGLPLYGLQELLEIASANQAHLCPRIVLGVRIGMAETSVLGLPARPPGKRRLTIVESDGCFADGVHAAAACPDA